MVKKKTSKKDIDKLVESILAKVPEDPKVKRKRKLMEKKIDQMSASMRGISVATGRR